MRLQQTFEDAVASLQNFLKEDNHPTDILWVFRDDLWKRTLTDVLVKYPLSTDNLVLAQKVFREGCERGLVALEVQGWDCGMKLSLAQPMPRATIVTPVRWWFFQFVPRFRQYQQLEWTIGTKQWAAA